MNPVESTRKASLRTGTDVSNWSAPVTIIIMNARQKVASVSRSAWEAKMRNLKRAPKMPKKEFKKRIKVLRAELRPRIRAEHRHKIAAAKRRLKKIAAAAKMAMQLLKKAATKKKSVIKSTSRRSQKC